VVPGLESAVIGLPPAERYSFHFAFAAQALDHALLNGPAQARFERAADGRGNADAPANDEFDAATAPLLGSRRAGAVLQRLIDATLQERFRHLPGRARSALTRQSGFGTAAGHGDTSGRFIYAGWKPGCTSRWPKALAQ
jgi:hypothetical protein